MTDRSPLSHADVIAVVRLLGEVAGMTEPVVDRRRRLIGGMAALVDADVWIWVCTRGAGTPNPMAFFFLDGGWSDDTERTRVWHANAQPEVLEAVGRGVDFGVHSTLLFDESHAGWGDGSFLAKQIEPTGLSRMLFSFYPLGPGVISGIGVHRRVGRPRFSPRDRALVHLIVGQIDWLHRADTDVPGNTDRLEKLTVREREILIHLLGADRRKAIAGKLGLSPHTLNDHCKSIYSVLGVSSRTGLLALFMPTGRPAPPSLSDRGLR
jgi:DNA-binding CsgD family transcriptional regulator